MTGLSPYHKLLLVGVLVVALLFTTIVVFAWVDEWQKRRKLKVKRGRGRRRS